MRKKVIYWLSRAIRLEENPALEKAYSIAVENNLTLEIHFFALKDFKYANARTMHFLLKGLLELSQKCVNLNIPVIVTQRNPLDYFQKETDLIHSIITEQATLRAMRSLQKEVKEWSQTHQIQFIRLNTSCVVPIEIASDKCEYAARTFRPKIMSKYQSFLNVSRPLEPLQQALQKTFNELDYETIYDFYKDKAPMPIDWLIPGENAANEQLTLFINKGLEHYHLRNEVELKASSYLSAYLHYGMISPRKVIRDVLQTNHINATAFIEQTLVRRELAENYCFYQEHYDSIQGAWNWAQITLKNHEKDIRDVLYTLDQLENSLTHDPLWNQCQDEVREKGFLQGYLRMYWAKQVLYWSTDAQDAIDKLIYLNDTYLIDGRDPNGYVGIMWSIAGVHDRPWFDKPVFGLVRTMSTQGTLKKSKIIQK